MTRWLFAMSLFLVALNAAQSAVEFPLLHRLQKAHSGDFVVFESGKTITLIAIRSTNKQSIILEEITAPTPKPKPENWVGWIQAKAPGHTSWSMIELDLTSKQVLECYSFNAHGWLNSSNNFLASLLHLPLSVVDVKERRRIGPQPQEGEPDRRKIWNPPLIMNGKKIEGATFTAFEARWPQDGSELSDKTVNLYFDREGRSPLPCWIQVDTGEVSVSLRAIDSGHKLPASIHRNMPRRIPEFVGAPVKTKNGLRLSVKSPKYYKSFELFAVDVTNKEKQIHLITHSLEQGQGDLLNLEIDSEELHQVLQPDHKYTWLLVPTGFSSSYTELQKPFLWQ
jgi:hypothetical protein